MAVTIMPRGRGPQSALFRTNIISDAAGGTTYLNTVDFYRPGNTNFGMTIQAKGPNPVAVAYTLTDAETACNPLTQASVQWDTIGNVSNDYLDDGGRKATAIRFIFTGVSEVFVACL